jgi:hypothetical protein
MMAIEGSGDMRFRALVAGVSAAFLLGAGAAGTAAAAKHDKSKQQGPNSFDGSCRLYGDLAFDQPIGPLPRTTSFTDSSTGTCSGKLNGVQRDSIPVVNTVTGWGTISCSTGNAHTSDTLMFARRYPIHIFTESTFGLTQGVAHSWGAVSGESVEHVNLLPYTDQALLERCQAGALRSAHYELDAQTISPFVG